MKDAPLRCVRISWWFWVSCLALVGPLLLAAQFTGKPKVLTAPLLLLYLAARKSETIPMSRCRRCRFRDGGALLVVVVGVAVVVLALVLTLTTLHWIPMAIILLIPTALIPTAAGAWSRASSSRCLRIDRSGILLRIPRPDITRQVLSEAQPIPSARPGAIGPWWHGRELSLPRGATIESDRCLLCGSGERLRTEERRFCAPGIGMEARVTLTFCDLCRNRMARRTRIGRIVGLGALILLGAGAWSLELGFVGLLAAVFGWWLVLVALDAWPRFGPRCRAIEDERIYLRLPDPDVSRKALSGARKVEKRATSGHS